jgi:hypothetical protein
VTTFICPKPCQQCHDRRAILDKDDRLRCANCNTTRGRVSGRTTAFVEAVVKKFGRLDQPVQLRHQQKERGAEERRE